jgi:hypothetical protein
MADRAPFIHAGANTPPQWNNGGTLTAAVTGDYIVYHYFANPMVGGWSIFGRPHNAKFTSLATALAARPTQLNWSNYAELKHIYTAIFRVNTGWANSHRCKLVSLSDYRTVAGTPVAAVAPTNHAGLSGLELAGAGVTWGHVNDQAQTIAGNKTLSGFTVLGAGPAIKIKTLSGTTPSTQGASVTIAHGLTFNKIISCTVLVIQGGGSLLVPHSYLNSAGNQFDYYIDTTNVQINTVASNSSNIVSRTITVTIIYEE